jgi:hypothetical protein
MAAKVDTHGGGYQQPDTQWAGNVELNQQHQAQTLKWIPGE